MRDRSLCQLDQRVDRLEQERQKLGTETETEIVLLQTRPVDVCCKGFEWQFPSWSCNSSGWPRSTLSSQLCSTVATRSMAVSYGQAPLQVLQILCMLLVLRRYCRVMYAQFQAPSKRTAAGMPT